jgi:hypothetical protein
LFKPSTWNPRGANRRAAIASTARSCRWRTAISTIGTRTPGGWIYGGNGDELAAGTVFLLPYYMGLYHGFIEKPGS